MLHELGKTDAGSGEPVGVALEARAELHLYRVGTAGPGRPPKCEAEALRALLREGLQPGFLAPRDALLGAHPTDCTFSRIT